MINLVAIKQERDLPNQEHAMGHSHSQSVSIKQEESIVMNWSDQMPSAAFDSQISIRKEGISLSQGQDALLTAKTDNDHTVVSLPFQVKIEPTSEDELEYKQETTVDYPTDIIVKQETIEVKREHDAGQMKMSNDENRGALPDDVFPKSENNELIIPDISEQDIKSDSSEEMDMKHENFQKHIEGPNHIDKTGCMCTICGKVFTTNQICLQHMWENHTVQDPYTCELCGKAFKSMFEFNCHKLSHSNERPYSCDLCQKTFKQKDYVQKHKVLCHSDERPHICDLCEKTFKKKSSLNLHKATIHSDERPHACDECEKAFKRKGDLNKHKAICHSDIKPYACDLCNETFKRKAELFKHEGITCPLRKRIHK